MCTVVVKYMDGYGWVGFKCRDRNYKPGIRFKQSFKDDVESLYMFDKNTKYSEGVNEYGVCILNAATAVKNDESEAALARRAEKAKAKKEGSWTAPDGYKLRKALKCKTPKDAAEYLAGQRLVGNTAIFNQDTCLLLEGGRDKQQFEDAMKATAEDPEYEWPKMEYVYTIKEIPKDEILIRTNHGHILPWLGYQKNSDDDKQIRSRASSESRFNYAKKLSKDANGPYELIDSMSQLPNKDTQMNPCRVGDYQNRTKLKTTGLLCLVPKKKELIYVPVWCNLELDNLTSLNHTKTKTFLTIKSRNINESAKFYLQMI